MMQLRKRQSEEVDIENSKNGEMDYDYNDKSKSRDTRDFLKIVLPSLYRMKNRHGQRTMRCRALIRL